ncbi:FAD binding domain-containing protein [Leekyejoonella antrihumi]|uniref:FAD binding domain-containing protein n=1 Tax=Leekyejoonella antrihumi TaxID=1660198 RepID=UPI001C93E62F|nr:xanthine dehydrogenase family protein subunit M [Leekyejoonella antrihumi]
MKPESFSFYVAESTQHALDILAQEGDDSKILAGGQSLIPLMNFRLARPAALVDVCHIPGSERITVDNAGVRFRCSVRHRDALHSNEVNAVAPLVGQALKWVGHEAIRSRGTLCGSTAHADPAAELPAVWLALGAEMVISGPHGERHVPAESFFKSFFTTDLNADEMLTEIRVPPAPDPSLRRTAFQEIARRHGDFAIVGAAVVIDLDGSGRIAAARVSALGAGEVPMRLRSAEAMLVGSPLDDQELLENVEAEVRKSVQPPGDSHASARYRKKVTGTLVRRSLAECAETPSTYEGML